MILLNRLVETRQRRQALGTELSPDSHPPLYNKSSPRNAGQRNYWNVKSRIRATVFHSYGHGQVSTRLVASSHGARTSRRGVRSQTGGSRCVPCQEGGPLVAAVYPCPVPEACTSIESSRRVRDSEVCVQAGP